MFRSQAIRATRTSSPAVLALSKVKRVRRYATEPPTGGEVKKPQSSNTLLYALIAGSVAGGAYWYYTNPDEAANLEAKAKRDQEEASRKAKEASDAGKARIEDAYKQGQLKYDQVKSAADKTIHDAEERAKQAAGEAQVRFDEYRKGAERGLSGVKDSTEGLFNDARASVSKKYDEVKADVQKKEEKVSAGWFSWLGWGKSKAEDAKKAGAEKVSEAAGDVKSSADKRV